MDAIQVLTAVTLLLMLNVITISSKEIHAENIISVGCYLKNRMEIAHCVSADRSVLTDPEQSFKAVPNGTECTLHTHSGNEVVVTCISGQWKTQVFSSSCTDLCQPVAPTNQSPTISCPVVTSNFYTDKEQVTSFVSWSPATASDPEDGAISVSQTQGVNPGTYLNEGTYSVTYTAKDSKDATVSCSFSFNVIVRRCPVDYTTLSHGTTSCQPSNNPNIYGSQCSYSCAQGYELVGSSLLECGSNQEWNYIKPSCQARVCSVPPQVANGNIVCPNGQTYQSVCNLSCNQGYQPLSPITVQCDINIQWTQVGSCLDVEPPNFPTGCPASFEVLAARLGESTYVTYQYPSVMENSGQSVVVVGYPVSGASFNIGTTTVNITATDAQGNSQSCTFEINVKTRTCAAPNLDNTGTISYYCPNGYVYGTECKLSCTEGTPVIGPSTITCDTKGSSNDVQWVWSSNSKPYCAVQTCSRLPSPTNGAMSCEKLSPAGEVCAIMCNTNFTYPASAPEQYICLSATGRWNPNNFVPNCTVHIRPGQLITKLSIYYFSGTCNKNRTDIKEKFKDFMSRLGLEDVCENQCTVDNIDVTCGPVTNARRKRRSGMWYEYKISPSIHFGKVNASSRLRYLEDLVSSVNDHLKNRLDSGVLLVPKLGMHDLIERGEAVISCDPGTLFIQKTMSCAGCGPGHMYNNETNSCTACPPGTYQDQEISFSCRPCPSGTYTKHDMYTSLNMCVVSN